LNGFGICDGGTAEFLNDHKQQILYGKAGVGRAQRPGSPIFVVVAPAERAIVAAQLGNDLLKTPTQFVHFGPLTIEGGNRFVVI
jgi:hypothetical protein